MKTKTIFVYIILLFILIFVIIFNDKITAYFVTMLNPTNKVVIEKNNEYYKDYDFEYLQNSNTFIPYSYNQLLNVYYSILNSGYETFTFYCPSEYTECINDINNISKDNEILTHINNYVHPFNSFKNIKTTYDSTGQVTVNITKLYDNLEIQAINDRIDKLLKEIINDDMDIEEKIRIIHDNIINNTKYDKEKLETNETIYKSNIAYGPLVEGHAVCSGYADAMAIIMSRLNLKNYRIATDSHIWNAVFIEDEWKHLDLTWDDQIVEDGSDILIHKFYLINTNKLLEFDKDDHNFNKTIYQEFLNN